MGDPSPKSNVSQQQKLSSKQSKHQSRRSGENPEANVEHVSRNPYLNFLREYRKKNTGKNYKDVIINGAKAWRKSSDKCKRKYMPKEPKKPEGKKKAIRRWRRRSQSSHSDF